MARQARKTPSMRPWPPAPFSYLRLQRFWIQLAHKSILVTRLVYVASSRGTSGKMILPDEQNCV